MDLYAERVAGIDISKADVKVCTRVPGRGARQVEQTRTFQTTTGGLLAVTDWLAELAVTLVVMESTGVYWKPVFYTLEDQFTCWLLNPLQVKKVPGRKTDVTDAQWMARLAEYGLVRPSFVPPPAIRQLRDLTRFRASLVHERVRAVQRLHDLLEDAGIKLSLVATDITGASGRAMLAALIDGQTNPERLAQLAKGSMRLKIPALVQALTGHFNRHHARLATMMLKQIDALGDDIIDLEISIAAQLLPFARQVDHLKTIPGVNENTAAVVIAELGADMTQFPSPAHATSWAGLCPGNNQSGPRRLSSKTRPGNPHLGAALYLSAASASQTKNTYLAEKYRRLVVRRGKNRTLVAISRIILESTWHILHDDVDYHDLGPYYLARLSDPIRRTRYLTHELNKIGYTVTLQPRNTQPSPPPTPPTPRVFD